MGEIWPENEGHADSGLRRSNHAVRGVEENLNYVYDLTHPSELEYPIHMNLLLFILYCWSVKRDGAEEESTM